MSAPKFAPRTFDAIVLGLGGMGSAAAAQLAQRGARVLGLETFLPLHANGSSHGRSRIIRQAYFEAPEYVPLLLRSYDLWRDLEAESGQTLLKVTGGLNIGAPESDFVTGAARSARHFNLPAETLSAAEVRARFPGFQLPESLVAVYEPNAGILRPEACVRAALDVAERRGAELHFQEPVLDWQANGDGVTVRTPQGRYTAERLVIAAGPWSYSVLADLGLPLTVRRIVNAHFAPTAPDRFRPEVCPIYLIKVPEGEFYGFPDMPDEGVKIGGPHEGGTECTPETIDRDVHPEEVALLRRVLDRYLPGASGDVIRTLTCMYTNTPDRDFIIDRHPAYPQVIFGCGFSGHGFKFASAVGEIMAELALEGRTRHQIGFLAAARFAGAGDGLLRPQSG